MYSFYYFWCMQNHDFFMQICLNLASKAFPYNAPNPMVGCVIVCDNKIIGQGYHKKYGKKHAEVNAIESVENKELLLKSTLYVNLEPCSHFGKTPPCSNIIIKHKIPNVVIGCVDSNSKVSGSGIQKLKDAGINVSTGILEKKSRYLNRRFFTFHEKKRPYIILKWAKSKDGLMAPKNQTGSFWMTSKESKKLVHRWRSEEQAILVGKNTVIKDDPQLTVRECKGKNPIRITIDKKLQISKDMKIFNNDASTIVFNQIMNKEINTTKFFKISFENLIDNILLYLYKIGIQSVIIEGGQKILKSFIDINQWDEARIFTTKKMLKEGLKSPILVNLKGVKKQIGDDTLEIIHNK